jgi:hypothetical protein
MKNRTRYGDRKADILRVLVGEARKGKTITYSALGKQVRIPPTGPWKAVLDELARDEAGKGHPDITHLVIASRTGYPSQIEFEDARRPTPAQKARSDEITGAIFAFYSKT